MKSSKGRLGLLAIAGAGSIVAAVLDGGAAVGGRSITQAPSPIQARRGLRITLVMPPDDNAAMVAILKDLAVPANAARLAGE